MLLLMRIAIIGLRLFYCKFENLGQGPSNPVAVDGSNAFMYDGTCSGDTNGIFKYEKCLQHSHLSYFNYLEW